MLLFGRGPFAHKDSEPQAGIFLPLLPLLICEPLMAKISYAFSGAPACCSESFLPKLFR